MIIRMLLVSALAFLTACAMQAEDPRIGWEALQDGDFEKAVEVWQPLAERGDARAQTNLGTMYSKGDGVEQDEQVAVEWFSKAAEQGFAPGQHALGLMYANGQGVEQDFVTAYAWLALAAVQNNEGSREALDIASEDMSAEEISAAQALSREYYEKYVLPYQNN